jgi:hypothetical protein
VDNRRGESWAGLAPLVSQPQVASAVVRKFSLTGWDGVVPFSIVQRKALSPNSFDSLDELADRLLRLGEHYPQIARPFDWTVTRADLERMPAKITEREPRLALAA